MEYLRGEIGADSEGYKRNFKNFPTCQKLILIPHRYLHLFPLHALPITLEEGGCNPPLQNDPVGAKRLRPIPAIPLQDLFPKGITYAPNCQLLLPLLNPLCRLGGMKGNPTFFKLVLP
ncbi:hypothetical protein K4A83_06465 [Spirulina subsalsa FACHB-351]|uniref:Uncharacterized protein n=1 Tax=Spirulina subsalsa FACHB-351 TaxID=234711 RepID=A0ABT3L326_9CYAN|nr:hypothetical protein [Spirulina subsalsa]MCW6035915.1 hypothetical protein [Spirulina subsalsa FACHB-351]